MDVLQEIHENYKLFSAKEKEIANYILKYKTNINNITITELSKKIGASTSTITRFTKKIKCESFVDMKMKLNSSNLVSNKINNDDLFFNVHNYYSEVINRTKLLLNKDQIYSLIEDIKNAKKIYIYGVGSSGLTATELMQRLLRMGFNVSSVTDSHMMIINSAIVSQDDLVIALSISGETQEVVNSLRVCKKNKAKTIGITSSKSSSLASFSDELFLIYNSNFLDQNRFINSQFSTIYLLDLISTILLKDRDLNEKMQITIDAILK